eukprot:5425372-Pyramimonas_sp.AAC.1
MAGCATRWRAVGGNQSTQEDPGSGQPVASNQRANTLADYFEKVQWDIKYAGIQPEDNASMGEQLPMDTNTFTMGELTEALKALAVGKAAGHDGIAPEFWKLLRMSSTAST